MPIASRPSLRSSAPTLGPTNSTRVTSSGPTRSASAVSRRMMRSVCAVISPGAGALACPGAAAASAVGAGSAATRRSPWNFSRNSRLSPTRTTLAFSTPTASSTSRIGPSLTGPSPVKRTCISVPPAKSTPMRKPRIGMPARPTTITITDAVTQIFHLPMKSILVPGRMISKGMPLLDRELGHGTVTGMEVVEAPREHERREDARDDAHRERHGEALDRSGAVLEQHQRGDQRRRVRVEDRPEGLLEAGGDGRARRAPGAELLADALEDDDVRVHRHADGEHEPGDAGHR